MNEISISDSYDFARLNKQKREVKNHYIYNDYLNFAKRGDKESFLHTIELYYLFLKLEY